MDMEFDIPTLAVNPNNVKTAINPNNVKTAINPNNVKTAINPNNVKTAINPNNVKTGIHPNNLVKTSINPNNVGKTGIDPKSVETKQGLPVKHVRSRAKSHQPPNQQKNKTSVDNKLNKSINSFEKEPDRNEEKRPRRSATLSVNYADEFDEQGFRKTGKPSNNPKSIENVVEKVSTNNEIDILPSIYSRGMKRKSVANKVDENVTVTKVTKTKSAGEALVENESNKRSKRLNSSVNTETILSNPVNASPMPINAPLSKKPLPRNPTQAKRYSLPAARNSLPAPRNPLPPPDNLTRTAPVRNVPPPIAGNHPSTAKDVPQNKPIAHNVRNIGNTLAGPITNALESTRNAHPILGNTPLSVTNAPWTGVNSPSTRRKAVAVKRNAISTPLNLPLNQMNIPLAKSNSYSAQRKLPLPQGSLLTPKNIRLTPQNLSKFKFLQAKKRYGLHPQKANLERGQRSKYKYPRSLEQITEKKVYFWGRKGRNQNYTLIKRQLRNKCDVPNTNKNQVKSFTTKNEKEFIIKEECKTKPLTQTITNSSTEVKTNEENPQISKYDQFESIKHDRIFQATKDADLGDNKGNSAIEIEDETKTIKLDSIKMENKIMTESYPNIPEQKNIKETLGKLEGPILSESAKKDFMPLFNNNPDLSWEEAKHKCDECNLKYIVKCHLLAHNRRVHVKKNYLNLSNKNNISDSTSNLNVKAETKDQQKSSTQFENELVSDKGKNQDSFESDGESDGEVGSSEESEEEGGSEGEDDDMAVNEEAYCENCDVEYDPSSGDHSQCG